MNRKARRAGLKSGQPASNQRSGDQSSAAIAQLMAQARFLYQRGQADKAQEICAQILARDPAQVNALNLLGLILQASGRHKFAVKNLSKAIAADPLNAACHYDIACSLQALDQASEATAHFRQSILFGAGLKNPEDLILRNPAVAACIGDIEESWPLPVRPDELFARYSLQSIATDLYLRAALTTVLLHRAALEKLLTSIRAMLLGSAASDFTATDGAPVRLFCAMAQQCFINEYVFAQSDQETRQSIQLRDVLLEKLQNGDAITPTNRWRKPPITNPFPR
jgi:tetratricopeptide (TPR) repeat protein